MAGVRMGIYDFQKWCLVYEAVVSTPARAPPPPGTRTPGAPASACARV